MFSKALVVVHLAGAVHLANRHSSLNNRHNLLVLGCSGQHNLKPQLPQALGLHLVS